MSTELVGDIARGITPVFAPLTVQQFHAMIAQGILEEGAAIELIDGLLVRKDRRDAGGDITTVGPQHAAVVTKLARILDEQLSGTGSHVRTQQPVTLNGVGEPEPDVSVVTGQPRDFGSHHPGPAEVTLVIEVADSSLEYDRSVKQRIYAVAGIPNYWIVNLRDNVIESFERPLTAEEHYSSQVGYKPTEEMTIQVGATPITITVGDVL